MGLKPTTFCSEDRCSAIEPLKLDIYTYYNQWFNKQQSCFAHSFVTKLVAALEIPRTCYMLPVSQISTPSHAGVPFWPTPGVRLKCHDTLMRCFVRAIHNLLNLDSKWSTIRFQFYYYYHFYSWGTLLALMVHTYDLISIWVSKPKGIYWECGWWLLHSHSCTHTLTQSHSQ